MSTPLPKRRRLNGPSALHKPFKSPFRTPLATNPNPPDTPPSSDNFEPNSDHPDEVPKAIEQPCAQPSAQTPFRNPYQPITPSTTQPRPRHYPSPFGNLRQASSTPSTTRPQSSAPTSTALALRTASLHTQIHTLTQAIQLLRNPHSDSNLEDLSSKWRTASRAAAEELFATSRERVQRMGGVGAWRDKERESRARVLQWEEERLDEEVGLSSSDDEDDEEDQEDQEAGRKLSVEEKDMRRDARREARSMARERRDAMKAQIRERRAVEDASASRDTGGDDSFTLDMMLGTLNVDLSVIGYSKTVQGWIG